MCVRSILTLDKVEGGRVFGHCESLDAQAAAT